MKFLDRAKYLGIPLTWETIRCTWEGTGGVPRLITVAEIQAFALGKIGSASNHELMRVADLTSQDSHDEISDELSQLAPEISNRAVRACRLLHVHQALDQLPSEPMGGLMGLTSLWGSLGFPADSPHVVQGRGNAIAPGEYFTEGNFQAILARHQAWVTAEVAFLRSE
jgi:hypothetical protein